MNTKSLPPELEAQARELAQQSAYLHVIRPRPSEQEFIDALREMAQRTLGWAAKEMTDHVHKSPHDSITLAVVVYYAAWLRSLAGQEERDGK